MGTAAVGSVDQSVPVTTGGCTWQHYEELWSPGKALEGGFLVQRLSHSTHGSNTLSSLVSQVTTEEQQPFRGSWEHWQPWEGAAWCLEGHWRTLRSRYNAVSSWAIECDRKQLSRPGRHSDGSRASPALGPPGEGADTQHLWSTGTRGRACEGHLGRLVLGLGPRRPTQQQIVPCCPFSCPVLPLWGLKRASTF